jgi:Beta-lactamase class C and other penicillin binding proteins
MKLVAPTEKQKDGSVLLGEVHDPLARVINKGNSGNAGVFSCAEDIAILSAALMNGGEINGKRVLGTQTVKTMIRVPKETKELGRSLGWDNYSPYASNNGNLFDPECTFGHTGYTGTSIVIDPISKTAVILLTNRVHPEDKGGVVRLRALVSNIVAGAIEE